MDPHAPLLVDKLTLTATTSELVTYTCLREANEYAFLFTLPSVRHNEVDGRVILPKTALSSGGARARAPGLQNLPFFSLPAGIVSGRVAAEPPPQ